MTTVINLNLLNFLKVNQESVAVKDNNVRSRVSSQVNDESSRKPRDHFDIIDVTPINRVTDDTETVVGEPLRLVHTDDADFPTRFIPQNVNLSYNREGQQTLEYETKGVYFDAYV
ncbi:MAG: hypothetical protein ISR96_01430 [Nitrospira sp.]|nr:hypothetical protein [bacterium]MBL7048176.1 hypothetical protein [Nitrospira sp.]